MADETTYWIEQGVLAILGQVGADCPDLLGRRRCLTLLPPVGGLFRLWGSYAPARAAGCAAGIGLSPLRAAARAALCEFAPWPVATVRPLLVRAMSDAARPAWRRALDPATVRDLWDELAVAWARWLPAELPALHQRLHERCLGDAPSELWRQRLASLAAERTPLPVDDAPEPRPRLVWTPAQRARACLREARRAYRREHLQPLSG